MDQFVQQGLGFETASLGELVAAIETGVDAMVTKKKNCATTLTKCKRYITESGFRFPSEE